MKIQLINYLYNSTSNNFKKNCTFDQTFSILPILIRGIVLREN